MWIALLADMRLRLRLGGLLTAIALTNGGCNDRPAVAVCPPKSGISITKIGRTRIDKVDLLIVVDNSAGMAEKQAELARRMPELLRALTTEPPDAPTTRPVRAPDVHVGVITSSLGSHGTSACAVELAGRASNDRAHLLPRSATECATTLAGAALSWVYKSDGTAQLKGSEGATQLQAATACVVNSAGENGCGFEETWESLYHFLVDPAPYAKAEVKCTFGVDGDACGSNKIVVEGLDEEILAQRRAFLRQDSVLAVLVLSDENDFSLKPAGLNWLPWGYGAGKMQRGWEACKDVPDDFEPETANDFKKLHDEYKCFSCFENTADPNCALKWPTEPNTDVDAKNLRGFQQTQRYGYNFLWGRQRYVDAFTKPQVFGSDNKLAANPVFQGGFRTSDLIVVGTLVGVPSALVNKELTADDWDKIVGPIGKRDPRMIESVAKRDGVADDRDIVAGDDLQYACGPRKAYPGLRHLRIAHDLGNSGVVGSICDDNYSAALSGVTKKLKAALDSNCMRTLLTPDPNGVTDCLIVETLREGTDDGRRCEDVAKGLCTPGSPSCRATGITVEHAAQQLNLPIATTRPDGIVIMRGTQAIVENGNVYVIGEDHPLPKKHLVCEVRQLRGEDLSACINTLTPPPLDGWCYSQKPELLSDICIKSGTPGTVRYLGGAATRPGSEIFTFCGVGLQTGVCGS